MKTLAFYTTKDGGYGYRENYGGWKPGNKIMSQDGKQIQTIFKISALTKDTLDIMKSTMRKCKVYAGAGKTKIVLTTTGYYTRTKKWNDGTGLEYFKLVVSTLPDAE